MVGLDGCVARTAALHQGGGADTSECMMHRACNGPNRNSAERVNNGVMIQEGEGAVAERLASVQSGLDREIARGERKGMGARLLGDTEVNDRIFIFLKR